MAVEIRHASSYDAEQIYHLVKNILPVPNRDAWLTRWYWLHVDNPWLRKDTPVGFVAYDGPHLVGHLGLLQIPVRWKGVEIVCNSSETFAVHPTYQGRGIGYQLAARAWNSRAVPQPVSFTANEDSTRLFEKCGGKIAPPAISSIRLGILDVDAFIRRLQSEAGILGRTTMLPGFTLPTRLITRAYLNWRLYSIRNLAGWSIDEIDSGHPELENHCASSFQDNLLSISVTPDYIKWRYDNAPTATGVTYRILSIRDHNGELSTVAVLGERQQSDWTGVIGELMELILAPAADLTRVLACLVSYGRSRKWVALRSTFVSPEWDRTCRLAGMVRHKGSANDRTMIKPVNLLQTASEVISATSHWNIGMGCRL